MCSKNVNVDPSIILWTEFRNVITKEMLRSMDGVHFPSEGICPAVVLSNLLSIYTCIYCMTFQFLDVIEIDVSSCQST